MKNHLKRLAAPKTWHIRRKGAKFVTKPMPGPHSLQNGISLNALLKEMLGYAASTNEAKKILKLNEVKIDGKSRKDFRFPVGIFDTIEFTGADECFRVVLNKKGKMGMIKIKKEEASLKPSKIIGKTMVKGKLQLNLYDGKNILVDKNTYKIGDSLILKLPEQKISKHLKLDKKSIICLIGGTHIGEIGNVDDIIKDKIIYRDPHNNLIETSKQYAFVVGDDKLLITLE